MYRKVDVNGWISPCERDRDRGCSLLHFKRNFLLTYVECPQLLPRGRSKSDLIGGCRSSKSATLEDTFGINNWSWKHTSIRGNTLVRKEHHLSINGNTFQHINPESNEERAKKLRLTQTTQLMEVPKFHGCSRCRCLVPASMSKWNTKWSVYRYITNSRGAEENKL